MSARPARPNLILALAAALALLGTCWRDRAAAASDADPAALPTAGRGAADGGVHSSAARNDPERAVVPRRVLPGIAGSRPLPTVERVSRLSRYFEDKYRGFAIDAVVPIGGRALEFASDHLSGVLADVPVVFALAAVPQTNPSGLPPNVTGRIADRVAVRANAVDGARAPTGRRAGGRHRRRERGRFLSRSPRSTRRSPTSATRSTCPSFRGWRSTRCSEGFARFPSVAS